MQCDSDGQIQFVVGKTMEIREKHNITIIGTELQSRKIEKYFNRFHWSKGRTTMERRVVIWKRE